MNESETIGFDSLSAALLFLKRIVPRTPRDAWTLVRQLTLTTDPAIAAVNLEVPAALLGLPGREELLQACGGRIPAPAFRPGAGGSIPLAEVHRYTELEATGRTEQARTVLVLPRPEDPTPGKLVTALAALAGWQVRSRRFADAEGGPGFFELQSVSGQPESPPLGLPGSPFVLSALGDDVFVPPGLTHPLLPAYRFLFPPPARGTLHLWLPTGGRRPEWRCLRESDEPPADLARLVLLNHISGRTLPRTPAKANPEVALELRRSRTRRRLNRAARVLYRVRSRASEFGPLLLRFLDLAEAGVEELTYFSHAAGEGPNTVIEHYLLASAALSDDDLWPELDRFDCPRTLEDHGLPLFLPAELDFCPRVEGLLRGGDGDDSFLSQLRERIGLPEAGATDGVLAVILPESSAAHWQVMHLAGGRPLCEVITIINRQAHREPVRRALDVTRLDLTADRVRYEDRWHKLGQAEAEEAVAATEAQIRQLGEATEALADELKRYDARLEASRAVTEPAAELLSHGLPRSLGNFADRTAQLLAELAQPQRAWLADTEARQAQLQQVHADVRVLQENATERVARVRSEVETSSQALAELQQRLQAGAEQLASAGRDLETAIQEANGIASATESELRRRADVLQAHLERLQEQERNLATLDERLRRDEAEVVSLEQRVAAERSRLEAKNADLEGRRRRIEAETRRLERMEREELPALAEQLRNREDELKELQQRGIERRHAQVVADLAAKDRELGQARLTAADLERQEEQLKLRTSEHRELTERIRSLRLQLERMPPAPTLETVAATRNVAGAAELAVASAQAAREHLDRALVATKTARADGEFQPAELALSTLATAIDSALRAAESARPADRLTSLEAGLRDLSARVAALRSRQPSMLGRFFKRFRS
jgi:hypothetical protein